MHAQERLTAAAAEDDDDAVADAVLGRAPASLMVIRNRAANSSSEMAAGLRLTPAASGSGADASVSSVTMAV
jgi:hypothetical protein